MSSTVTLETLQVVMEANTKKFNEEIKKVQNQVKTMTDSVNKQVSKVKSAISSITKSVVGLFALSKVSKYIQNSLQSAMQVEASLQQVARTMGESTQSFLKWAKTNALSFNMAQSDALKFGATYSNLVSSFLSDTNQITGATTELLKASSVIASATGRTMDDVMERIRSGLLGNTEAIEDLGVNVNVALLETTEAFKRLANGKSWNQLSFQTQQQIRLMAILEQTASKFGNEVFQNTNSSLQQLVAILKDVALNLGNAFLPIANVVIPLLSKMAMWLRTVTSYFATFMQTLFGYSPKANAGIGGTVNSTIGQVGNLGDSLDSAGTSADKTKKKLQNLLGGFDELNTISFDTSSDSGSSGTGGVGAGASGLDFGSLGNWDGYDLGEPDTSGIVRAAEKVKEVFRNIARFISENKAIILAIIGGLVAGVATYLGIMALGGTVGDVIAAFQLLPVFIAEACSGVIGSVVGLVTGISWPAVAIAAVIAGIVASFIYLWQTSDDFRQSLIEGWNNLVSIITPLVQSVVAIFKTLGDMFWTFLKPIVIIFADFFVTCIDNIVQVVMSFWNNVLAPFVQFFADCVKKLVDGIAEIWASWKPTIEQIGNILIIIWNTTLKPFINWLGGVFIDAFRNLGSYIKPILDDLKRAFSGLVDFITGVLTGNWRKAWQGIVDVFGGVFGGIVDIAKSPLNAVISLVNSAISSLNRISVSIPSWVPGFGGKSFGISIPKIPMLARGGMIGSPTLAMIGEAGYNEAVVPLDRDAKAVSMIAELLAEKMPQGASSGNSDSFGGGDLILMIDGSVIGKVALQQLRKMQRQGNITLIPT
ncbi:phage tail protein [Turicibacter sanguinis]|uniref:phage tail protein n=2 Tax=Turicibacter sanguinis TaxID=154288 RepID=UPI0018AB1225|nr:hypothetical protein [Turicibacter sanguinis]MDB8564591.1 hypothetical protein [Turicibacter sanguinis]MDB8576419.1 hypothetical protein [Turicibacter sanguinis]MDB8579360.1 hypothetical protein [Turicibacter sanguinis]MDB8585109.1 hypothetical protein [Turicibacter sanguinis]MDB8588062.1 hypothetical protein [Turicibacter sanguinis]